MKQQVDTSYKLFKIPQVQLTGNPKKHKIIIGLIDASGSMGSYWAAMAKFWNQTIAQTAGFLITFSHVAKLEASTILDENLSKHGGGATNILSAFEKLQEILIKLPEEAPITIVFISDGQDTCNGGEAQLKSKMSKLNGGQGRNITMICLGIQSGFPTRMSMDIRALYHTGDEKIPALYLIEYASEKAFFNKFQTISECFQVANTVKCVQGFELMKEYPWQKDGEVDFKEKKWILAHNSLPKVTFLYNQVEERSFQIPALQSLQIDDLVDCFRGWVQKVQLLSINTAKIKETAIIAQETVDLMKEYTKVYEKHHNIYILSEKPLGIKDSFKSRAGSLAVKNIGSRIIWFIDQLQIISKGVGIGLLSESEAAKRIGIGTITGKYHQKALALKGITVKDFQIIKEQFTQIFSKTKLSEKPSNQQGSIITLQNQKEIFQQPDLLEGLKMCKNQYDLVQTFPVVGYSLKVKRYDGSLINPWKVRVLQLAKTHKSIDSMYLANNNNKYQLSIGQGQKEEINAVLPLFGQDDNEMSDLFNTKLFKLAVSFMVVQNIDTYHDEAYMALLASTFIFLLKEPHSQWRSGLLQLIYQSLKVTYGATQSFRAAVASYEDNPHLLFTAKEKEDHTDISKVMLLVYYIFKQNRISKEKLFHLIDLVLVHYVEKTYVENEFKLTRVVNIQVKVNQESNQIQQKQLQKQQNCFNIIKDHAQLKKIVQNNLTKVIDLKSIDIDFSQKIFLHQDEQRRVTYSHISNYYHYLRGQPLPNIDFIYYFGHALKGKDPEVYNTPIVRDIDSVKKEVLKKINPKQLGPNQGKNIKNIKKLIQQKHLNLFKITHFGILPFTAQKLKSTCLQRGIDFQTLVLNETSGMLQNACMSPKCKYFLLKLSHNEFIEHMRLWRKSIPPKFHHTVTGLLRKGTTPQQVCQILITHGFVNLTRHKKSQQFVLDYIRQIADSLTH